MKKIVSTILLCVLLCGSIFSLASCGNMIMGTYSAKGDLLGLASSEVTLEFGIGKVEITSKSDNILTGENVSTYSAKYKIGEDAAGKRTISFTYDEGADEFAGFPAGEALDFQQGTVEGVDYIKIGITQYNKVEK